MKLLEALKTRWIVWVWSHTPDCAEMSSLASLSFDRPISVKVLLRMRLHYLVCVWCKRYYKHLIFLHRAAPQLADRLASGSGRNLSNDAKQRMKKKLNEIHGP